MRRKNHYIRKIILSVLEIISLNLVSIIFAIIAISHTNKEHNYYMNGNVDASIRQGRKAVISLLIGLIAIVIEIAGIGSFMAVKGLSVSDVIHGKFSKQEKSKKKHDEKIKFEDINIEYESEESETETTVEYTGNIQIDKTKINEFQLEGNIYKLPIGVKDFEMSGYKISKDEYDEDFSLDPGLTIKYDIVNDDKEIVGNALVVNPSNSSCRMEDAQIYGIGFNNMCDKIPEFTIFEGVNFETNINQIIEILGQPYFFGEKIIGEEGLEKTSWKFTDNMATIGYDNVNCYIYTKDDKPEFIYFELKNGY